LFRDVFSFVNYSRPINNDNIINQHCDNDDDDDDDD